MRFLPSIRTYRSEVLALAISFGSVLGCGSGGSDSSAVRASRVLFTIDGERMELLGRGLLGLPDVDGDGTPDLLVSAWDYALICSGKDGCVIYRLDTPEDTSPDALPRHPTLVGDLDEDGRSDFSLEGESAFHDADPKLPFVHLYSSANGKLLAKYGGAPIGTQDGMFALRALGAGDLDGDGNLEILVENWPRGTHSTSIYTFGSDVPRADVTGIPMGATPDVDGDRVRDVLLCDDAWYDPWGSAWGWIVSGADGRVLRKHANPGLRGRLQAAESAGDVDLDGFPDVLLVHELAKDGSLPVDAGVGLECRLLSGRDGAILHFWTETTSWSGGLLDAGGLDDLDGDGIREVFIATQSGIRIYSGSTRESVLALTGILCDDVTTIGDLDRDGVAELAVSDSGTGDYTGRVTVYSVGPAKR